MPSTASFIDRQYCYLGAIGDDHPWGSAALLTGTVARQGERDHCVSRELGLCWRPIWAHQNCVHIKERERALGPALGTVPSARGWTSESSTTV